MGLIEPDASAGLGAPTRFDARGGGEDVRARPQVYGRAGQAGVKPGIRRMCGKS
jgi:hypothetical protein